MDQILEVSLARALLCTAEVATKRVDVGKVSGRHVSSATLWAPASRLRCTKRRGRMTWHQQGRQGGKSFCKRHL